MFESPLDVDGCTKRSAEVTVEVAAEVVGRVTGLTSSLSSTRTRFLPEGPTPGALVGVMLTKGLTLLTASAKGLSSSSSSKAVEAFLFEFILVLTILLMVIWWVRLVELFVVITIH